MSVVRFPPRYAGMEGKMRTHGKPLVCFPRATRGWKVAQGLLGVCVEVSPALRGDGRATSCGDLDVTPFPPRYAGMEGLASFYGWRGMRFPRATRGWKGEDYAELLQVSVSPALRGDGRW